MCNNFCCIDNNMMAFIPKPDFSTGYIYFLFQNLSFGKLVEVTALPSLSSENLRNILLKIPASYEEQQAIADVLFDMDTEIEKLEQKMHKYEKIKQGMMQQLLTGRIRLINDEGKCN